MKAPSLCLTLAALAGVLAALPLLAPSASADPEWNRGRGDGRWRNERTWDRDRGRENRRWPRYVMVRRSRVVVLRPAYVDVFVVRRPRFVVARPVPVWLAPYGSGISGRVGIHTRRLNVDLSFAKQRPYYGCSFCDEYFSSYDRWASHMQRCGARPPGRVLCERWDDDQFQACQDQADQAWSRDRGGYDDDGGPYDDDDR